MRISKVHMGDVYPFFRDKNDVHYIIFLRIDIKSNLV